MAIKVTYRISVMAKGELESYKYTPIYFTFLFKFLMRSSYMAQLARVVKILSRSKV